MAIIDMQRLQVRIRLPDGHWAGDSTRANHHLTLSVEEHMPLPHGRGTANIAVFGYEADRFRECLDEHPGVEEVHVFRESDDRLEMTVNIGRGGGGFLRAMMEAEIVPRTPFEVRDGWVEWDFTTDHEHARHLIEGLKRAGVPHRVISFSKAKETRLLTVRQRQVFDAAVAHGYYDTPRRITLTNLAGELSVSKSTLCEMIHLIERQIMNEYCESVRRHSPSN